MARGGRRRQGAQGPASERTGGAWDPPEAVVSSGGDAAVDM